MDETLVAQCHTEWALPDLATRCLPLTCTRPCLMVADILTSKATEAPLKVWLQRNFKFVCVQINISTGYMPPQQQYGYHDPSQQIPPQQQQQQQQHHQGGRGY